jgi:hypothetical protein
MGFFLNLDVPFNPSENDTIWLMFQPNASNMILTVIEK